MTDMTAIDGNGRNALRPFLWGGAACLLLLPAVAMRAFPEAGVQWTASDFAVMGAMLATACGLYEVAAWRSGSRMYRAASGVAVLAAFMTAWVNLAVGMLGSEHDALNLLFAGVLLVAASGALASRLRPAGMARAMAATGVAQLLAAGVGLALGDFQARELAFTALFCLPWLLSAALFRRAAPSTR